MRGPRYRRPLVRPVPFKIVVAAGAHSDLMPSDMHLTVVDTLKDYDL